jgi:hypothetical protein
MYDVIPHIATQATTRLMRNKNIGKYYKFMSPIKKKCYYYIIGVRRIKPFIRPFIKPFIINLIILFYEPLGLQICCSYAAGNELSGESTL